MSPTTTRSAAASLATLIALAVGCDALLQTRPIFRQSELEKLLAGHPLAKRVGMARCLDACHFHDELRRNFEASTHTGR